MEMDKGKMNVLNRFGRAFVLLALAIFCHGCRRTEGADAAAPAETPSAECPAPEIGQPIAEAVGRIHHCWFEWIALDDDGTTNICYTGYTSDGRDKLDRYRRIIGVVYVDNVEINLTMVATGNAWHYKAFDSSHAYSEAEKSARENRLGLWAGSNVISPQEWRRRRKQ